MKRISIGLFALAAATALVASPALAKKAHHTAVTCQKIKDAIASGKTADDVAKEMKVSAARVKACTTPAKPRKSKKAAKQG
ncbi:MAG TPA: hypothetical protein VKW76_14660 [Candidatus Binatia bacterium]|nr:hypothetical protein [Candidatus Binatia bacterium]